ncbi:MAG: CRTAC1 family protein [Pseudomonadota bacterium]
MSFRSPTLAAFTAPLPTLFPFLLLCLASAANGASAVPPPLAKFVDETESSGLQSRYDGEWEYMVGGGTGVFDCDGDGLPEVVTAGGVNKSRFFHNRSAKGAAIKLQEERVGLEFTGVTGLYPIDIDGDGITDLVLLRVGENIAMRGLGQCKFERANEKWSFAGGNAWSTSFSATWLQGDNWPTLAVGNYIDRRRTDFPWGSCTENQLIRPKDGGGFAVAEPLKPSFCTLSMLFSDWDRSGNPALRISNDREYYKGGQEQLWRVEAGKAAHAYTADEGWKPLQIWGMGIASADIDGSGYPSYFLTSMADNKLQMLEGGPGKPSYKDGAYDRGVTAHRPFSGGDVHPSTAWHAQFADVNNDSYNDLFIVKGNVASMAEFAAVDPNNLLLGAANGRFTESAEAANVISGRRGRGGMLTDLNGDGLLDMVVINRWDKAQLWRNVGAGTAAAPAPLGHWLQVRLQQEGGNRDAIGAWLEVDVDGRVLRQEHTIGGGHASGHLGWMHVGIGKAKSAKLRVIWPGKQAGPWVKVEADQFLQVDRQQGIKRWTAAQP